SGARHAGVDAGRERPYPALGARAADAGVHRPRAAADLRRPARAARPLSIAGATLMHIHILGICGTFMAGIAAIAKSAGHRVTGSDRNVYPPMSTQLESLGIELIQGFDAAQLQPRPDVVVVGNV